jgi:S-adenosylhomocysteine hydrolase
MEKMADQASSATSHFDSEIQVARLEASSNVKEHEFVRPETVAR